MDQQIQKITFEDELLTDGTVCRRYSDGRIEWRRQLQEKNKVGWRDNLGAAGEDELLGEGIIKRTLTTGRVIYGREQGYGRTLWSERNILTINRTSYGGRVGGLLAAFTGGALLGTLVPPPQSMTPMKEEELRRRAANQEQNSSSGGTSGGGDGWEDSSEDSGDGDFG